jgi:ATP-dependent Clp protease adaptor protein ClpS
VADGAYRLGVATPLAPAPERIDAPGEEDVPQYDTPWNVIVWNDPITLMSYVVLVFRQLFGYDEPTANKLMLQVHHQGRAVVATEPREKAEWYVFRLHEYGLQATLALS